MVRWWILTGIVVAVLLLMLSFCGRAQAFTLVHVKTKAGMITVNAQYSERFRGFIDALPYTPRHVVCFAAHGHVKHSLHHIGAACDIDQHGRNRTSRVMYRVHRLALAYNLRDGCSFHDCGHVDIGRSTASHVIIVMQQHAKHQHKRHRIYRSDYVA